MSKSATEQFQIKKKRKHPLNINATTTLLLNKSSKRYLLHSQVLPTSDLLIKENYSEYQIDDKTSKFNNTNNNSLLQINKSTATAAATAAALYNLNNSKCITLTSSAAAAAPPTTTTTSPTPLTDSTVAAAAVAALGAIRTQNCLRDQSQVLCHDNIMPLSHGFYVKGALASKRGLKSMKSTTASGSSATGPTLSSHEEAKRPRKSNENLKLRSPSLMAGQTANNLQLSYLFGESLARHGRLQEAFDMYALIASEQPEGFIPLEKLNILATALLEHIRILSSNSKKSNEQMDSESKDSLNFQINSTNLSSKNSNMEHHKLITPLRNKYASATASQSLKWQLPSLHSSKLKEMDTEFLTSAVGGNLDLHAPSRELEGATNSPSPEEYDPLLCPLCRDVLRCPVTTNCGHTFCRQCCETITMCNICHVKFPRLQKEDYSINDSSNLNINFNVQNQNKALDLTTPLATLSTATTTTTITSMDLNQHQQTLYPSATSSSTFTTSLSATTSSSSTSSSSSSMQLRELPRLQIIATPIASPTTVTTTTIACTTDTATTTMASTASTSGGAMRSNSSPDNMKFMPDVLVRRLVEKWWGADLQAKKINETATSYMHLNLLDDALKYCNASLEKCK